MFKRALIVSVVLLTIKMPNQVLAICFGGIVIDKDVQSDFDYVLRWCCD